MDASKEETDKNVPAKKKVKLADAFPQVEKCTVDTKSAAIITTPSKPETDKKKSNKRKRPSIDNHLVSAPETTVKQPKTMEETPSDAQLSLENEALMATQSILDTDDSNDFFMETTPMPHHLASIANEIIAETSFEKDETNETNESIDQSNELSATTTPLVVETSIAPPSPILPSTTTSILTIPVTMVTPSSSSKTILKVQDGASITPKTELKFKENITLSKNILQPTAAKQVNFPSLYLKTTNTASPASFIVKTNQNSGGVKLKAATGSQNTKFLTQQQLISNAILLQQQQQLFQKQQQLNVQVSQPLQQQSKQQQNVKLPQPLQQAIKQQQQLQQRIKQQQQLQQKQKQQATQLIQQQQNQQTTKIKNQQQQIIRLSQPLQQAIKQSQQQQQTAKQQQIRPQFLISAKALHGKQSVASLQQLINRSKTASASTTQGKQDAVINIKQHQSSIVKPVQTPHLGLTLGNFSSTSLQNINQLISSTKRNINNASNQGAAATNLSLVNTTIAITLNKPAQPSGNTVKRTVPVSPVAGAKDLQNNLWSPIQQTPTNIVQQFIPVNNTKPTTQVRNIDKKQPLTVTVTTKPTKNNQPSPVQTLSLNQLMAAARANLQTATIRPVNNTGTPGQINVQKVRSNGSGPTLQALLHVVPKSASGGTPNNAQLLIQPQLTVSTGDLPKVVPLPSSAGAAKPNLSTVTLQKQTSSGQVQSPGTKVPVKARNIVAPLKISLPRTAFPANATVRMPVNTIGSLLNRTPTNIVFSSPNTILTGQSPKSTVPKGSSEKK